MHDFQKVLCSHATQIIFWFRGLLGSCVLYGLAPGIQILVQVEKNLCALCAKLLSFKFLNQRHCRVER